MPRETYDQGVPTVAPSGPSGNDYVHVDMPQGAGAFGGLQARALEQSGSALEGAGNNLAGTADLIQGRYNEVAHQQATNDFLEQVQGVAWGTPDKPGVLQKRGADALGAWQQATDDIDQLRQKIRGGLQNDAQRLAFDNTSRFYQLREQDRIGAHVDAQVQQYAADTSSAGVKSAAMRAGADPTSDLDTLTREAYLNGTRLVQSRDGAAVDPTTLDVGMRVAAGTVVFSRLNSLADTDPAAAADLLKNGSIPSPDGKSRIPIQSVLDETGRTQLAQKIDARAAQSVGTGAAMREFQTATQAGRVDDATAGRAKLIYDGLVKRGLDPNVALGFAANAVGESAAKPNNIGDGTAAHGLFMWRNSGDDHRLDAYVQQHGHTPDQGSVDEQLDHVVWELNGRESVANQQIAAAPNTPQAKAQAVSQFFERPQDVALNASTRAAYAQQLAGRWGIGGAAPTTNDAQGPIPGSSRRQALQNIINNPDLRKNPAAMTHAMAMLDHLFEQDDHAAHADAEGAFNEWIPQVRLNPAAVDPTKIANDGRLTGEQKSNLLGLLSDRSQGDGPSFGPAWQRLYLPVGDPNRINSVGDLFSLAGHGLTASGMEKLGREIKTRDEPDNEVKKAALDGWKKTIEGVPGGLVSPGPISSAKWAQFLGWALPEIEREKSGKTMAQIISPTGDIAKAAQHYQLTPEEIPLNLGAPIGPATPTATPGPAAPAPIPIAGQWYIGTRSVPAGTPGARYYNGGAMADPASWPTVAPAAAPSAPTSER